MDQNPWEAKSFSANQEIPRTFVNPNVHYHIYKSSPLVPILNHSNPVHAPTELPENPF